ncbi:MAG: tRNA-specific 2-thiouridylase MnmA, partial [uncultured bacterium]
GLPLYTIGQRRGLVGGTGPYYAAKFDYRKNILYVVKNWNENILYEKSLVAKKVNWLSGKPPVKEFKCGAVIRYGHSAVNCLVAPKNKADYLVTFLKPQRAVTPGQSVVFYDKKRVLGGGIIAARK